MRAGVTTLINSADISHQAAIWKHYSEKGRLTLACSRWISPIKRHYAFLLASVETLISADTYEFISTENDNV